ncbi:prepilin peptidase [Amphibacillus sp. MSJ-3]|uniref:prepilin peptidase n=1 Tax=Amphibacillus sp. MSJ-3 TaxID=2841505 RepID=UPI001C0EA6D1|nr:A24 family peptidase [Amphibacillus sp. MSJ-3]MBU5593603.1 prepilin peptidase [Amphibacillus sp. MSJ-3]
METFFYSLFFLIGTIFGSFFNVVGLRVPKQQFFNSIRSYCPKCQKKLQWYELIPIFSYFCQMGKCRGCHQPIGKIYPFIEVLTGLSFALSYWRFNLTLELIIALFVISLAVIIIVTDYTYFLIPNKLLLYFSPLFIVGRIFVPLTPWWSPILGALIGFCLLLTIIIVSNGGMGAGDMKYFAVLGIVFGFPHILIVFFLSTLYGAIISFILLLFKKVTRYSKLPFGPYISLATITVMLFGDQILISYLSLIN